MSKNVLHAENQQERLIQIGWILGFVDGEGCFSINFIKQPERKEINRVRRGYRLGYQVAHEFAVTQGEKSLESLQLLYKYFGVGNIYVNKRYDNHKEHLYRYVVRKREDLLTVIIPFFETYSLHTLKKYDFENFAVCVRLMENNEHLKKEGLITIMKISESMNHKKKKTEIIRILRNQTLAPKL